MIENVVKEFFEPGSTGNKGAEIHAKSFTEALEKPFFFLKLLKLNDLPTEAVALSSVAVFFAIIH